MSDSISIKKERESNFELLRILAMSAIILGHFFDQSKSFEQLTGLNLFGAVFLGSAACISVNIFLLIGTWFMVDSKFRASRILNLYYQLLFYTLSIFIILKILHLKVSFLYSIQAVFPLFGWDLWFVSAYIFLILLSPFLNLILNLKRDVLKKLLIILFFIIPFMSTFWVSQINKLSCIFYFTFTYLCVGYFKKYIYKNADNLYNRNFLKGWNLLIIPTIVYLIFVCIKYYFLQNGNINNSIYLLNKAYIADYKSIPNLLCSIPIFLYFTKLDIGRNNVINKIAKSTLSVYIIHQTHSFIPYIWTSVYHCNYWLNTDYFIWYSFFVVISLYVMCSIVDYIRQKIFEPFWMKTLYYRFLEKHLNNFYKDINNRGDVINV